MAVITYESVTPSLIENTVMRKKLLDGVFAVYTIQSAEGYLLHDKNGDYYVVDPDTLEETGEVRQGYTAREITVSKNYNFTTQEMTAVNGQTVTAYGSREIYAIPATEVPENQIFGGVDNNHEVM